MAQIGLLIDISGLTNDLLIVWKKASSPLAEVGRSEPLPFPVDQVYTIPDLFPGTYIVEFWRTTDGVTLDEFIKSWTIDSSKSALYGETKYTYVVGRGQSESGVWADPSENDGDVSTPLVDTRLAGVTSDNCYIKSRGFGDYRADEITFLESGGFYFSDGATRFSEGDTFFAVVLSKSDLVTEAGDSGAGYFNDIIELRDDIDNSIDFSSTHYNKICHTGFTGTVGTIVFPLFALIPDTKVRFIAHRGSQNYLKLQFASGETIIHEGEEKNVIYLERGAMIEIWWKNNVGYIADYKGNNQKRGQVVGDYSQRSGMAMFIAADGTLREGSQYPGIIEFINQKLSPGSVVSLTDWAANPTKWGYNDSTKQFKTPNLANLYRRFSDGSNVAGAYQGDQIGPFTLTIPPSKLSTNDSGATDNKLATGSAASPGAGIDISYSPAGITETRVKGVIEYPLIYL